MTPADSGVAHRPDLRVILLGAVAAILVVVAAGLSGAARLPGPRFSHSAGGQSGGTAPSQPGQASSSAGGSLTTSSHFGHIDALWPLVGLLVFGLAAIAVVSWQRWRRRRGRGTPRLTRTAMGPASAVDPLEAESEPEPDAPIEDLEAAVAGLEEPGEPGDAVIRAWLSLEAAADRSGVTRRRAETPSEFTTRVIGRAFGDEQAIRALLVLYLRARFSERPPSPQECRAVSGALARLLTSWRAAHVEPVGGRQR